MMDARRSERSTDVTGTRRSVGTESGTREPARVFKVIASATATIWVFHGLAAVSGLVALPLIVAHLGKTEYGVWVLILQTVRILSMSDLGVGNAIGRFVSRFRGAGDAASLRKLYATAMAMLAASGVLVALLTVALSFWLPHLLGIEDRYHTQTSIAFGVIGMSLALQLPLMMGVGILTGHQRYGPHAAGKIVGALANLVGVVVLAGAGCLGLIPLALLQGGSMVVGGAVVITVAWRATRPWSLSFRNISPRLAKDILDVGCSNLLTTLGQTLYQAGLAIAVGRLLSVEAAATYGIALTLITHVVPLVNSLSTPFATLSSELQASGDLVNLRQTSNVVMRVTFALSTSVAAGLYIYGESLVRMLLSRSTFSAQDFHQASVAISIMACGAALGLPQFISIETLKGVGKHWAVTRGTFVAGAASLLIGIVAIQAGWHVYGAAAGWSAFWIGQGVLYYPYHMSKVLKQSVAQVVARCYLPGAVVGGLVLGMAWIMSRCLTPTSLSRLVLGVVLCVLFGCSQILVISGESRTVFRRIARAV